MSFQLEPVWQRVLAGDRRAWRELILHFESLVYSLATRAGLSSADAADCFQHTWVSLYQHRHRIKDSQRLPGWIATTVKRESFRRLRAQGRQTPLEDLPETPDGQPDPSQELEQTERQFYLEAALARLDERCRGLLRALFYEENEHSYSGLAGELGLSINAIGPLRKRCLARLREQLEMDGFSVARERGAGQRRKSARKPARRALSGESAKKGTLRLRRSKRHRRDEL